MRLDTLLSYVRPFAPAAPDPLIVEQLRLALDDLADTTGFWLEDWESTVDSGEARYTVQAPSGLVLRKIEEVRLNGFLLNPAPLADWMSSRDAWPAETGVPESYAMERPDALVLDAKPSPPDTGWILTAKMSVRPGAGTLNPPDWVVRDQGRVIVAGARALLAAMPDRPWTNEKIEATEGGRFASGINDLAWKAGKQFGRAGLAGRARFL